MREWEERVVPGSSAAARAVSQIGRGRRERTVAVKPNHNIISVFMFVMLRTGAALGNQMR